MFKKQKAMSMTASLLVAGTILAGCGSSEEVVKETEKEASAAVSQPSLEAEFAQDGSNVTITWSTDLTISADHYGGDHVDGEGHAHVYVDGEKVAGLKNTDPYTVEGLEPGTHIVKLELQQNNHESYSVSKETEVTVEENSASTTPTLEAEFSQDGNNVVIKWNTDLNISAEHYGGEHVDGEGHAHVYVDGEKIAGLKNTDPYVVENLTAGKHIISIELQQNDHQPLDIKKEFEVEIN
ncbi:DUF6130 family protein [Bacillus sp. SG-1]|uniref:DUF6130 family protein n=1 Tax=Bacillus sp. SG-1 TaxID=161544 RepID=UPI00031C702E|nr:DUF6130 family protein [Bacillus sp. SG-1]